jgi:hypothetical protein
MNIRVVFGYLSFALSAVCCAFQFVSLPGGELLPPHRLLVLCLVTVLFILGSLLALESPRRGHLQLVAVAAFVLCGVALISVAAFAVIGPLKMEPFKYALILFYGLLYGVLGLSVSLLVHRRFDRIKI